MATLSNTISILSAQISAISTQISVLSVGLGGMQMKVVAGNQAAFSAALVKISGLSASLAASTYQLEAQLLFSVSGTGSVAFGISLSAAAFTGVAGKWEVMQSIASNLTSSGQTGTHTIGFFRAIGVDQVIIVPGTTGLVLRATMDAVARCTTPGSIQLKARGVTGGPVVIMQGSFFRAYLIG